MKFFVEQLALCPRDPIAAKMLLTEMGAGEWANDHVCAEGVVYGDPGKNEADLAFEYKLMPGGRELEILHYTSGPNWMAKHGPSVSHLGMHCTEEELLQWCEFFAQRGIRIAQAVETQSHTNPAINGKRRYAYVIFDTRDILSVDVKFIVRYML